MPETINHEPVRSESTSLEGAEETVTKQSADAQHIEVLCINVAQF